MLRLPLMGISNQRRKQRETILSSVCLTHVSDKFAIVRSQLIFDSTKRWQIRSLDFGCRGREFILSIRDVSFSTSLSLFPSSDIEKLKCFPKYSKESFISTGFTLLLLRNRFGFTCFDELPTFFIPNAKHLSTCTIISLHAHHLANALSNIWFSDSKLLTAAASSANWSQ